MIQRSGETGRKVLPEVPLTKWRRTMIDGVWRAAVSRVLAGAVAALMACSAQGAQSPLGDFSVDEIAPGNFVHFGSLEDRSPANLGDQANVGFIVGERCVAVIDTGGSRAVGEALAGAVRRITDKPVCYVVITHFHPDHFFGAAAFRGADVKFVSHEAYSRAMGILARPYSNALKRDLGEAAAGSDIVSPTVAVKTGQDLRLDLGGRTLSLRAWPVAHTNNDLTVVEESTNTLWLGDLLFIDHTPVVDGSISGFLAVLDMLAAMPVRHFVPGHGRSPLPWPRVLDRQRDYLSLIVRETREALKFRKTLEQAMDSVGGSEAAKWVNFDLYHQRNVSAAYTELEWE